MSTPTRTRRRLSRRRFLTSLLGLFSLPLLPGFPLPPLSSLSLSSRQQLPMNAFLPSEARLYPAPGVRAWPRLGSRLLLDGRHRRFYWLNSTGAELWMLLQQPGTVKEIVALWQRRYRLPASQARSDVHSFLLIVRSHRLVRMVTP